MITQENARETKQKRDMTHHAGAFVNVKQCNTNTDAMFSHVSFEGVTLAPGSPRSDRSTTNSVAPIRESVIDTNIHKAKVLAFFHRIRGVPNADEFFAVIHEHYKHSFHQDPIYKEISRCKTVLDLKPILCSSDAAYPRLLMDTISYYTSS